MLNNLFSTLAAVDATPGYMTEQTLAAGTNTTVIGMTVVFSVLLVLYLLFKIIAALDTAASKRLAKREKQAPAPMVEPSVTGSLDWQVVAAIVAAVEVCSGKPARQLKFTAIRRNNNAWNSSGTAQIINSRQQNL